MHVFLLFLSDDTVDGFEPQLLFPVAPSRRRYVYKYSRGRAGGSRCTQHGGLEDGTSHMRVTTHPHLGVLTVCDPPHRIETGLSLTLSALFQSSSGGGLALRGIQVRSKATKGFKKVQEWLIYP